MTGGARYGGSGRQRYWRMMTFDTKEQRPLFIDLDRCEASDPCSYDNTCRIHKLKAYLRETGQIVDEKKGEIRCLNTATTTTVQHRRTRKLLYW
jgi:hypothetical protein